MLQLVGPELLQTADNVARESYRDQLRVLREEAEQRAAEYVPHVLSADERDAWA